MTHRLRPARRGKLFSLYDMRRRRAERRLRNSHILSGSKADEHPPVGIPFEDTSHTEVDILPNPTGNYLADMLTERESILDRIETLQREIAKEHKDLAALDVVLSRIDPGPVRKKQASVLRTIEVLDAEFEVIRADSA